MENTHGEDILHLRERSGFILYAAERLFSDCKLVNLPLAFWKEAGLEVQACWGPAGDLLALQCCALSTI